jgi:hypothetical protein
MKQLPAQPANENERTLASELRETFTALTTDTLTLAETPLRTVNDVGLEQVCLNGQRLMAPDDYTITGKVITLLDPFGPLVADDVVTVHYPYRP